MTRDPHTNHGRFPIVTQLSLLTGGLLFLFAIAGGSVSSFFTSLYSEGKQPAATLSPLPMPATAQTIPVTITSEPRIEADAAYVWDIKTKRVLYEKNADTPLPLASITKLMTALVAYELVTEDTTVSVPLRAAQQESAHGLTIGEQFTLNDLLTLSLVSSANDAAYTLANSIGALLGPADATTQFVTAMNIRAEELGLSSLTFSNTTGLDIPGPKAGGIGSARDVSLLLAYMLEQYPSLLSTSTDATARVYNTDGTPHTIENTNPITTELPNLLASKTGYTDLAGGNLTIAFDAGFNRPIVITVLGSSREGRFTDVATLIAAINNQSI